MVIRPDLFAPAALLVEFKLVSMHVRQEGAAGFSHGENAGASKTFFVQFPLMTASTEEAIRRTSQASRATSSTDHNFVHKSQLL